MPKQTATNLINKFDTNNPFEIASFLNIHTIEWDLHEEINGYYKYDRRNQYIVINNCLGEQKKKFVCAHELGHSQLHPRTNTPFLRERTLFSTSKIEIEANQFAVELLLPDKYIYEYKDTSATLKEAAQAYGIPENICHLKDMQLIGR